MSEGIEKLRRSSRICKVMEKKEDYGECQQEERPNNKNEHTSDDIGNLELEKELETIAEDVIKPRELFGDQDIGANEFCRFQTRSRKNAMMVERAMLARTPTLGKDQHKLPVLKIVIEKTDIPSSKSRVVTVKSKNVLETGEQEEKIISRSAWSESESISDGSEFIPSEEDKSSSADDDDDDDDKAAELDVASSSDQDIDNRIKNGGTCKKIQPITASCKRGKCKKPIAYSDFRLQTDEYFDKQSEKTLTSDHTLARLTNPQLSEKILKGLLKYRNHVSKAHSMAMCRLTDYCQSSFPMWYHIMEEGYSLLLHGLGSKRNLINDFHKQVVANHPALIINGFFPSLTVKDILDGILVETMEMSSPTNTSEAYNLIENTLKENPDDRLYLLIHNIDGVTLRSKKAQDVLSRLAAIPNIRLLASVDHINGPLVWDNVEHSRYNFYWWDATTLLPYEAETSYESSLLVQKSGALALSSLHNVFTSLTANTKAIYILLVKHQLKNSNGPSYSGMSFKDLYHAAREGFLVSSDLALRAQLTEFLDHKLVKTKRNIDGTEYLSIPLDNALLEQFLNQQE